MADEVNFLRHVTGAYDRVLGQLCMRCGAVLHPGRDGTLSPAPALRALADRSDHGYPPGETILVSADGGFLAVESVLKADRDRSDEADCVSIVYAPASPVCECGHREDHHRYPDVEGGAGCWSCSCTEYSGPGG